VKDYDNEIVATAITLLNGWKKVINYDLSAFLKIVKYYETADKKFDFTGTLKLFEEWTRISPGDTYE